MEGQVGGVWRGGCAYSALGASAMPLLDADEGLEQLIELLPRDRPVVWMHERQRWDLKRLNDMLGVAARVQTQG